MNLEFCLQSARANLVQLLNLLRQINTKEFVITIEPYNKSTIGKHVRHILEYYDAVLLSHETKRIDFVNRKRDLLLENNLLYAISNIEKNIQCLNTLTENKSIILICENEEFNSTYQVQSNIERELLYAVEHAIHHMAIIKIACLSALPAIQFDNDFGVAYSTIKHTKNVHSNLCTHNE